MTEHDESPAGQHQDACLVSVHVGPLGTLRLEAVREAVLRAGRLAESLFRGAQADVIGLDGGAIWRGKHTDATVNEDLDRRLAAEPKPVWISDTCSDPACAGSDFRQPHAPRFAASAPIRLRSGALVGALRVLGLQPRARDPELSERLADLAEFVADQCERVLGSAERRVRELVEDAPGFMTIVRGPEHRYELANRAYRDYMGRRELFGRPAREVAGDLAGQGLVDICDQVYRSGVPYLGRGMKVFVQRESQGPPTETYVDFVFQPLREADGSISGIFCQGHEVTDLKLAEDELRASREELAAALSATEAIFDHSHDVICTVDRNGMFTKASRHCEQLWGYRPEELVGRPYMDFVHPDDFDRTRAIADQICGGQPTTAFMNRYLHKNGSIVPLMWSSVWSEAHQTMFAIARDMREHVAAEEKLRQAQKMEAVGRLTGGVAHDFNNLLTAVIGSAEALSDGLHDAPELQSMAQIVLEAAERGAELVNRLLAFSRRQPLAPQPIECAAFLQSFVRMVRRTLGEDIDVVVETDGGDLRCMADPAQLTSAMLNLCLNARDAMPNGGRLTLSARRQPEGDEAWVVLSVEDTGTGMAPEVVDRALEPFFTTKAVGEGSGLGLSMVYGFATQSGGRMDIESEPGRGVRVQLYLPETCDPVAAPDPRRSPPSPVGNSHILVVEDDDLVRDQVRRQLMILGYRVTTASQGREALRRLAETPDMDLMLTDVVMPGGMNGRQLADHARLLKPGLRVLFTSGYTEDAIVRGSVLDADLLPKPYRRAELGRRVAEALGDG
jgi:hypothetical protein